MNKPRLFRRYGLWFCSPINELDMRDMDTGMGPTPAAAFKDWLARSLAPYDF